MRIVKTIIITLAAGALTGCQQNKFHIKGQIDGADEKVLYFENVGLSGIEVLDSTKLDANGAFDFSHEATEAPEFYRLRIGDQIINLSVDSTETITVNAKAPAIASQYDVEGSDNCLKIKELALKQMALQAKAIALENNTSIGRDQMLDSLQLMLAAYKEDVKMNYIFREPNKAYAYFALFQTLGPWLIFDPKANADDVKVFAAVAPSWDTYYPGALRGENLHNIAIEGMKNVRIIAGSQSAPAIDNSKVVES